MRLFIAINFEESVKDKLTEIIAGLRAQASRGSFTLRENLHLTLVFIGETDRVKEIYPVMDSVRSERFTLTTGQAGRFRRSGGDIYWLGIDGSEKLSHIHRSLSGGLINRGFEFDARDFKPHLTLGRQVVLPESLHAGFRTDFCADAPPIKIDVNRISLMKSEHIGGKLTYTEIYAKLL